MRTRWTERQRDEIAVMILRARSATALLADIQAEYGCSEHSSRSIIGSVKKMLTAD